MGGLGRRLRTPRVLLLPVLLALTLGLGACSPEGARDFGAGRGSGADPDNRNAEVEMLPEENQENGIYYDTPDDLPPIADESG